LKAHKKTTILLVDDDRLVLRTLRDLFLDEYQILQASSGRESVELAAQNGGIAAVVMDIKMAGMDGIVAAREIREIAPDIAVIFHTGYPGDYQEDEIDEHERPFDYVQKSDAISRLRRAVRNAVESYRLKNDCRALCLAAEAEFDMIGRSKPMQEVYSLINKVCATDGKVMICGETGTGKELVARAIHRHSRRRNRRLAILNCNHKSPDLIESELFGHTRGAFTHAFEHRPGLFEYAHGGTVFLDEIGDLDATTQGKLLRVIETGEFQKIGTEITQQTDIRVICATHRNLEQMVADGQFREDLFYRLKGVKICLPPLRERREDIPVLVESFKDAFTIEQGLSPKIFEDTAIGLLVDSDWSGNVRQLRDTVESLIVLSDSDVILAEDVTKYLSLEADRETMESGGFSEQVRQFERNLIIRTLAREDYNISAAARVLQIDRANLRKKIQLYKIDPDTLRGDQ